jgi:hypothetical protein
MNSHTIVRRNPQVVARELAPPAGAVLLHLDTGAYHGLNRVGLIVWDLIDGKRAVADLVTGVRERIPAAPASVDEDVAAFVKGVIDRGLVEIVEPE